MACSTCTMSDCTSLTTASRSFWRTDHATAIAHFLRSGGIRKTYGANVKMFERRACVDQPCYCRSGSMRRSIAVGPFLVAGATGALRAMPTQPPPAGPPAWVGVWTLNRDLSEFPREIGFNPSWAVVPRDGQAGAPSGAGGGRRGGGGRTAASASSARSESYEDAQHREVLTAEARNPPARLTIVDAVTAVTITNDLGQSRTLHPDLRQEVIQVGGASIPVTTTREADRLIVVYHAAPNRDVQYIYSHPAD